MSTDIAEKKELVDQQDALQLYLESLLSIPTVVLEKPKQVKPTNLETPAPIEATPVAKTQAKTTKLPAWASPSFACLSINAGGMTLRIPRQFVKSVKKLDQTLLFSKHYPEWIQGILIEEAKCIPVVEATKVISQDSPETELKKQRDAGEYLVFIGEGRWALSCDAIGKVEDFNCRDFQWRSEKGKRHWLIARNTQDFSAIVDVRRIEMALIFENSLV